MSLLILILSTTMTKKFAIRQNLFSIIAQTRSQINPKEDTLGTILPKQAATLTTKSMQKHPNLRLSLLSQMTLYHPSQSIKLPIKCFVSFLLMSMACVRLKKDSLSGWLSAMPMWSVSKNHASLTNNGRINFAQRAGIRIYLLPKKQAMQELLFIAAYLLCRW